MSTLDEVTVDLSVLLGRSSMPVHQLLRMGRGAVIELDTKEDDEFSLLANNTPIAVGNVVVEGERIKLEVTRMLISTPDGQAA